MMTELEIPDEVLALPVVAAELDRHAVRHDDYAAELPKNTEKAMWHRTEAAVLRARAAKLRRSDGSGGDR
jgi:hypothetical protein